MIPDILQIEHMQPKESIMQKTAVVILNYMNYQETLICVESVLLQKNVSFQVVVVDNGSANESFRILAEQYRHNRLVHVIRARKNYGFARGNNIGIQYARKRLQTDFVLLINSDTVMTDKNYIYTLLSHIGKKVGVVGSEIILRSGKKQKPYYEYVEFPATFIYYCYLLSGLYGINALENRMERLLGKRRREQVMHGSALMLTPGYFEAYNGLYSRTFLYGEEILLYIMCKRAGLEQVYAGDTSIFHKEDQSSKFLFRNRNTVQAKYELQSYKYVVWESFKDFIKYKILKYRRMG